MRLRLTVPVLVRLLALGAAIAALNAAAQEPQARRAGRATANAASPQSVPLRDAAAGAPFPFIDVHVHLNDEAMQLALMEAHGARQAIVFWGGRSSNDSVADAASRHPDRFIAFASISPERTAYRPAWERDDAGLLDQLDAMLATGRFRGIGEICAVHFPSQGFGETDFDPEGPMMSGILALARKHAVPVLVHIEITRMAAFSRLLERYADVQVIWAHGGYTPLFIAERMLARHPNLSYELSARTWPRHPRSPDYTVLRDGRAVWPEWLSLIEAQPHRFVIGTDASQRSQSSDAMKFDSVQNLLAQLSVAARDAVARGNILRLLGEDPSALTVEPRKPDRKPPPDPRARRAVD